MKKDNIKSAETRRQQAKEKAKAVAAAAKEAASNVAIKVKGKVNKVTRTVKVKVKDYNDALKAAYADGYQNGFEAHETLPKLPGARAAATVGFSKGIKARAKYNKTQEQLKKGKSSRTAKRQTAKG